MERGERGKLIGAVDIGGTKIAVASVDRGGRVLMELSRPTMPEEGFDAALSHIITMLKTCASGSMEKFEGIGIGCTGPVDARTGIIGEVPFLPGWRGRNIVSELEKASGVSAVLENDADAHALGEFDWGSGRGASRFIMITVGTGIGCGMIFDGRLYRGAGGFHPEIGHHSIDWKSEACSCGSRGCWESAASGPALAALALKRYPEAGWSTAKAVCEAAEGGDCRAKALTDEEGEALGIGIANLITILIPDVVVLGGGIMKSFDLFAPVVRATVQKRCRLVPLEHTKILPSGLGGNSGVIGAAGAWLHRQEESGTESAGVWQKDGTR